MAGIVDTLNEWLKRRKPLDPAEYLFYKKAISEYFENAIYKGTENPLTKTPYMNFRESAGKNRGPDLDALILRNGGRLGDPYCVFGIQDLLRGAEIKFGVVFDLPKTGGVKAFFDQVKKEYKISTPKAFCISCYELIGTGKGHMVLSFGIINPKEHSTFEFNTSPNATPEMIRDGEGCYFKVRNIEGFGNMKLLGHIDIFESLKK